MGRSGCSHVAARTRRASCVETRLPTARRRPARAARGAGDTRQFLRRCTVISPYYISPPLTADCDLCIRPRPTHAVRGIARFPVRYSRRFNADRLHAKKYGLYATSVGVSVSVVPSAPPSYVSTQNLMRSATDWDAAVLVPLGLPTWARAWTNDWHNCPCPCLGSSPNRIARRRRGTRCASQ